MGWPVGHSHSPRLHGYWLDRYGIDGTYEALAVTPDELAGRLSSLAGWGFAGINLTVPHKEAALDAMASLSPAAYADISTYLLQMNKVPSGDTELPTDTDDLGDITITEPQ